VQRETRRAGQPRHGLSPLHPRDERDGPRARAGGRFINAWAEWSRRDTGTRARPRHDACMYMHLHMHLYMQGGVLIVCGKYICRLSVAASRLVALQRRCISVRLTHLRRIWEAKSNNKGTWLRQGVGGGARFSMVVTGYAATIEFRSRHHERTRPDLRLQLFTSRQFTPLDSRRLSPISDTLPPRPLTRPSYAGLALLSNRSLANSTIGKENSRAEKG
jgi:hypothetical protein